MIPTHLKHKPIIAVDNYDSLDGMYANATDAKSLSVGQAQYDVNAISAKVFRHPGVKWSRVSEELPLHRVFDLNTTILKSILESAGIPYPATNLPIKVMDKSNLMKIADYYRLHRTDLLPKLQELQIILNYFTQEEHKI
jgi:hypothetical protein